jgi:hypothetical protein
MWQTWKYCGAGVMAIAAFLAADSALAHWPLTRVSVEIVDRTENRVLPIYTHAGRRYVVGKPGNEYAIRVRNAGAERVLAVMSVDGVNIITGDTASTAQSGYVFSPNETAELAGWRKDMSRTAAFYFTALSDSYAARTGRPDNVGVIGVAVFRERPRTIRFGAPGIVSALPPPIAPSLRSAPRMPPRRRRQERSPRRPRRSRNWGPGTAAAKRRTRNTRASSARAIPRAKRSRSITTRTRICSHRACL